MPDFESGAFNRSAISPFLHYQWVRVLCKGGREFLDDARLLSESHPSLNGIDQFLRVVSLPVFEDNLDVFYVVDLLAGIAFDDDRM